MSQLTITITLPENVTATVTETPRRSGQRTIPSAPLKIMPKLIGGEPIAPFSLINKMIADLPKLTTSEMYELIHAIDETHRIKDLTYKEHVAAARSLYDEFQQTKQSQSAAAAAVEPAGHCDCDVKKALLTATPPAGMDVHLFRKIMAFRNVTKSVTGNEKLATCSMFSSYEKWCRDALTEKEKAHLNRYQRMTRFVNEMMAPIVSALANNRREELVNVKCPSWVLDELAQAIPSNRPPKAESPCDPFKEKLIQSLKQKKPVNIVATLYQRLNDFMKCFLNVRVPASVEHVVDLFQHYESWVSKLSEQEARHLNRYQRMTRFLNEH